MRETPSSNTRRTEPRNPLLLAAAGVLALVFWRSQARRGTRTREVEQVNPLTAYEPSDWDIGPVAWLYAGILALLVICVIVLMAAYPTSLPDANRDLRIAPPGPRLQTNAAADLRQFRADEQKRLDGYSWVDRQKGLVHIPIEQAMKNLVQTGIPGFPKAQQ